MYTQPGALFTPLPSQRLGVINQLINRHRGVKTGGSAGFRHLWMDEDQGMEEACVPPDF